MKKIIIIITIGLLLASATYAATFGYNTVGGTFTQVLTNEAAGYRFTSPEDTLAATSISMYANKSLLNGTMKMCIWRYSDGGLVGCTDATAVSGSAWVTSTISVALTASTDYIVGYVSGGNMFHYYDAGTAGYGATSTNNYTTPTNFTTTGVNDQKMSIYVTYNVIPVLNNKLNITNGGILNITGGGILNINP